ncbi:MAG: ATP-binding protein, partial [Terrimicrobiaceae bacterium]|nr:ATP-binding protein [Terrimicrobiaceae bacterium]
DPGGSIEYANDQFLRVTGYRPEEVMGQNVRLLKSGMMPASFYREMWETLLGTGRWHGIFHNRRKDGSLFWERASLSVIRDAAGRVRHLLAVKEEITREIEAEALMRRHLALAEGLAQTTSALLETSELEEGFSRAVEILGEASGHHRCYIFRNHPCPASGAPLVSQIHEWVAENIAPQFDNPGLQNLRISDDFGRWVEAFETGCMIAGHVREFPESERELLASQDIASLAVAPIMARGEWWGFIGWDHCFSEHGWSAVELAALKTAASALGAKVMRDDARRELIEANHRIRRSLEHESVLLARAQAADAAKAGVLASLSHDIRTPLNAILGMADLLLETPPGPSESREYLEIIKSSAEGLLDLVENLLDYSRLAAGMIPVEKTPFSPRQVIESVLRTLDFAARDKGLELRCEIAADFPEEVVGDQRHLRRILMNLVGNAVKFTAAGHVEVSAGIAAGKDNQPMLVVRVCDSGCGIPPGSEEKIFEPFVQAEPSGGGRHGGAGLGLSICRNLARLMGGEVEYEPREGGGSKFRVSLPRTIPGAESAFGAIEAVRRKVLVVDDSRVNRLIARRMIEKLGYDCGEAADGAAAVEACRSDEFDVVLMDLSMPGMNGFRAAQELRALPGKTAERPVIIALTASTSPADHRRS